MTGIEMIAEKVRTNAEHKSYNAAHDDQHIHSELVDAAMCYLRIVEASRRGRRRTPPWPFEAKAWKPSDDPIRNLVHAGALIVAEIERLQRRRDG